MNADDKTGRIFSGPIAVLLLALMGVLSGGAALHESVTVDEVSHIGAGVSYLQKLDLRMNPEHPPLPKMLAAIPLVLRGVYADYNHISWTFSDKYFPAFLGQWVFGEMLLEKWNEPKTVLAWARLPMLLVTLALGCVLYIFARQLGGAWGGLLCLSVFVSTPAFLTFGPLVHTDMTVTLFSMLSLWTFAHVWQEPNRKNVLLFAVSLAAALLSKFTAGALFFVLAVFALSLRWRPVPGQPADKAEARAWRRMRWRAVLKGVLWAALFVYAFYFVFSWHQPTDALYRLGSGPVALILRRLLFPPMLYLRAVFWVLVTSARPTFLLGHAHPHGVWYYFPVVFALKSPLAFLGLLLLSLAAAVSRRWWSRTGVAAIEAKLGVHWRVLWVSLIVSAAACMQSPLQISIRHFSVPLALLILMLTPLPRMLRELGARKRYVTALGSVAVLALAATCLFTAVRLYPFYFPYINALGMGRPAYTLVNDSNVDWNQSLPEVKRFAEQHGLQKIGLDAYGFSDFTVFVPQAQSWNCQEPAPQDAGQWVALSANFILDGHNCEWLMQYPYEALAGGSMYVVRLPVPIPPAGSAGGPPLPSAFREFGGALFDVRAVFTHVYQHPEDLPPTIQWMLDLFNTFRKLKGPPATIPKFPWEK
jgi:Dolichyl-phosphate-mannose-protein mannosyltransferase